VFFLPAWIVLCLLLPWSDRRQRYCVLPICPMKDSLLAAEASDVVAIRNAKIVKFRIWKSHVSHWWYSDHRCPPARD
jgi:hypothetical protein